jgi:hypothetical protein
VTSDEVDAFFAHSGRTLSAVPSWRTVTSRPGERRAEIPVSVDGRTSPVILSMTAFTFDPAYLSIVLLAPTCVSRLCLTIEHFDSVDKRIVEAPHFHSWEANRPNGQKLPQRLGRAAEIDADLPDRTAAFVWFLGQTGIESPHWRLEWPDPGVMI